MSTDEKNPCPIQSCVMQTLIEDMHLDICGDEKRGHRGLVRRVQDLEEKAEEIIKAKMLLEAQAQGGWAVLKREWQLITAIVAGAGSVGAFVSRVLPK